MPVTVQCVQCGSKSSVIPSRVSTFRFCSYKCRGAWRADNWTGENNPNWQGGDRVKECQLCGAGFTQNPTEAISTFAGRKFCSKACADKGGFRYRGEDHHNHRKDARRRNRDSAHAKWASDVISRDRATCQHCQAKGIELHAHHIKSYRDHPELRLDLSNGLTLCHVCHWAVHTAENDNGVNSGKPLTGNAEGNPEPSLSGNAQEGVTTRGRAYRRWEGECAKCGVFVSKSLSDVKHNAKVFCSKSCSALFNKNWLLRRPRQ